jgi:DNA polymerase-1
MSTAAVFDLTAMVHRAFHGGSVRAGKLASAWAISTLIELDPTHAAACVDRPGPTFRHEMFPAYKSTRRAKRAADPSRAQEEAKIRSHQLEAEEILRKHGVRVIGKAGVEADDCVAAFVQVARAGGLDVTIVANDKDLLQLVGDGVVGREFPSGLLVDKARVYEKFGVWPGQLVDYLALVGDATDDVPGVPQIGEKTAPLILLEYESIDQIFATREGALSKDAQRVVRAGREYVSLMKDLVTLRPELLDLALEDCTVDMVRVRGDEDSW